MTTHPSVLEDGSVIFSNEKQLLKEQKSSLSTVLEFGAASGLATTSLNGIGVWNSYFYQFKNFGSGKPNIGIDLIRDNLQISHQKSDTMGKVVDVTKQACILESYIYTY